MAWPLAPLAPTTAPTTLYGLTSPATRQSCNTTQLIPELGLSALVSGLTGPVHTAVAQRAAVGPRAVASARLGSLDTAPDFANLRDRFAATWSEPPRSPDTCSASAAPCRRRARVTRVISHGDCAIRHHHGDAHHNRVQRATTLWCRSAPLRADTFGHDPRARVPGSCTIQRRPLRLPGHSPLAWLRRHQLPCPTNRASHLHMPQQRCCPARPRRHPSRPACPPASVCHPPRHPSRGSPGPLALPPSLRAISHGFPMALAPGLRAAGHGDCATRLSRRTGRPDSRTTRPDLRAVSQAR